VWPRLRSSGAIAATSNLLVEDIIILFVAGI
jgi:hypothetical protein